MVFVEDTKRSVRLKLRDMDFGTRVKDVLTGRQVDVDGVSGEITVPPSDWGVTVLAG